MFFYFFFFFSSRRRHTRFDCDWSSDVCSSDLGVEAHQRQQLAHPRGDPGRRPALEPRHEPDVPLHSEVREQSDLLDHVADSPAQLRRRNAGRSLPRHHDLAGGGLEQPVDELQGRRLPRAAAPQQDQRLARGDGERNVLHEDSSLVPLPSSRQCIPEPPHLERRSHASAAKTMRKRSSSLRPCQRTASPASERIRRKVSAAYLYEWLMSSRSPRARRNTSPPVWASTSWRARKCFGMRCRPGSRGSSLASNTRSPSASRIPTAWSGAQAKRRLSGLS